jgi:hypothetical protein
VIPTSLNTQVLLLFLCEFADQLRGRQKDRVSDVVIDRAVLKWL